MNKVILMGRLTADPQIRYTDGPEPMAMARYTLALDRRVKKEGIQNADFISCMAYDRAGEFAEKYLHKGIKIAITGRLRSGSYTDKDGRKVYTMDVVIEEQEFAESKAANDQHAAAAGAPTGQPDSTGMRSTAKPAADSEGFMNMPEQEEDLPWMH